MEGEVAMGGYQGEVMFEPCLSATFFSATGDSCDDDEMTCHTLQDLCTNEGMRAVWAKLENNVIDF